MKAQLEKPLQTSTLHRRATLWGCFEEEEDEPPYCAVHNAICTKTLTSLFTTWVNVQADIRLVPMVVESYFSPNDVTRLHSP